MPKDNYLEIFVSESLEQLQQVSDGLLELEKDPANGELINRIFRFMHTLKGGASLDGLERISSLAHRMENIFGLLRDNNLELPADGFDPVLQAVDLLTALVEQVLEGGSHSLSTEKVDQALKQVQQQLMPDTNGQSVAAAADHSEKVLSADELQQINSLLDGKSKLFRISLNFKSGDMMSGVMAMVIYNNLENKGKYIRSFPGPEQLKANAGKITEVEILLVSTLSIAGVNKIIKLNCPIFEVSKIDAALLAKNYSREAEAEPADRQTAVPDEQKKIFFNELEQGRRVWKVSVSFPRTGPMQALHGFIVLKNLCEVADRCWSNPDEQHLRANSAGCGSMLLVLSGDLDRSKISRILRPNSQTFQIEELQRGELECDTPVAAPQGRSKFVSPVLEVDKVLVDGLIENVGDMVLNMNVSMQMFDDLLELETEDVAELKAEMLGVYAQLQTTALITNALMDYGVQMRMVPVGRLFKKFPRVVRDASRKAGKQVELEFSGERTRLDQEVIEALEAPLLHMVRNSVDHGIEPPGERSTLGKQEAGKIEIKAAAHKNLVHIAISDDGRGLDKEAIRKKAVEKGLLTAAEADSLSEEEVYKLIFRPGFSTKDQVSELSGRGVGMDVVLSSVESIRGEIKVESEPGGGSVFTLIVPTAI